MLFIVKGKFGILKFVNEINFLLRSRKIFILCIVFALIAVILIFLLMVRGQKENSLSSPSVLKPQQAANKILPSSTYIEYADPSGFSFNYPDNLSITKNETDDQTYADLQLSALGVNGSLSFKITDSKYKSLDEYVLANKGTSKDEPKEVKLGSLKALEIKLNDRLLTGALDQGILFVVEMPLLEEEFWMKVYNKILSDFTFAPPQTESTVTQGGSTSTGEVIFEGEELVE